MQGVGGCLHCTFSRMPIEGNEFGSNYGVKSGVCEECVWRVVCVKSGVCVKSVCYLVYRRYIFNLNS